MAGKKRNQKTAGPIRSGLHFYGTWRSYQARVLDNAERYLEDGRIHVVAAPGSGKTTLGIELIGRADRPCLILAPSITIREQWLDRIREDFGGAPELLSRDIRHPAAITAITYQALHSCLRRKENVEEDEDGSREEADYRAFDLYRALDTAGIGTFCLDEAHHLRSEWQKALEEVVGHYADPILIALTATPPYDSTPAQWNRYIGLCGPIDEEIGVPELVKEKSLCPHQDFVYFNLPTPEEAAALKKFCKESGKAYQALLQDETFRRAVFSYRGLSHPEEWERDSAQNRFYLLALLSFFQNGKQPIPPHLAETLGEMPIPEMNPALLAALLQGFLFEDTDSYDCPEAFRKTLADSLWAKGLIHKNQVELSASSEVDKMLTNSLGKLESICRIVKVEEKNLGADLRLLVLTDYIRGEYLSAVGRESQPIETLGVVPIFEALRRSGRVDGRLAALSGSVVILPQSAKDAFLQMAQENGQRAMLKECAAQGYYQVSLSGGGPRPAVYLTELFSQGLIRVLVGTKSLLGEGWDSPCINSLILASFVGSFMLSNQMRGRAIRTQRENPEKASNIWHLICMDPLWQETRDGVKSNRAMEGQTADFATLKRRFDSFLGVNYETDRIESGLGRLTYIRPPYGNVQLDHINEKMETLCADRKGLREKWARALAAMDGMETVERVGLFSGVLRAKGQFRKYQKRAGFGTAAAAAGAAAAILLGLAGHPFLAIVSLGGALAGVLYRAASKRSEAVFSSPQLFAEAVGNALLAALQELGEVSPNGLSVAVEQENAGGDSTGEKKGQPVYYACLRGGTQREKNLFADALAEFLGNVEQPRYLLQVTKPVAGERVFYPVPELFGRRKEDARCFAAHMAPCIGACDLIFTRTPEGRKILMAAGLRDLSAARETADGEEDGTFLRQKCVQTCEEGKKRGRK